MTENFNAMLLIGATGTGKTPFGSQLETQMIWGKRFHHFDFGEQLRNAVKDRPDILDADEIKRTSDILRSNSLLEEGDFPIAEKILKNFILQRKVSTENEVIILNGLPRHIGQAEALSAFININLVLFFSASARIIKERIEYNSGGDREGREDDTVEEIERKIEIFRNNTLPLIDYFKNLDKTVLSIDIDTDTIPLYIIQELKSMPPLI